jgi:hypothetical protein
MSTSSITPWTMIHTLYTGSDFPTVWRSGLDSGRDTGPLYCGCAVEPGASIELLEQTRRPERFHDFMAISGYLGRDKEPMRRFLVYHESDRRLARTIVHFIWDRLVEERHWEVCGQYLKQPNKKYETAILAFEQSMKLNRKNRQSWAPTIEEHLKKHYVTGVSNMLRVLMHTGKAATAIRIRARVVGDMKRLRHSDLVAEIDARVAEQSEP